MKVFDPDGFRRALSDLSSDEQSGGLSGAESHRLRRSARTRRRGIIFTGAVFDGSLVVHIGSYLGTSTTLSSKWIVALLHLCAMGCVGAFWACRARSEPAKKLWPPDIERALGGMAATVTTIPWWALVGFAGVAANAFRF